MDIINLTKAGGPYFMQSWPDHLAVPDGCAIVSDELDRSIFYSHNGFVVLTIEEGRVTAWEPDLEAWEAWKAEQPAPVEPAPTTEERLAAVEEATAQQGELLSILLSGETEASV